MIAKFKCKLIIIKIHSRNMIKYIFFFEKDYVINFFFKNKTSLDS